LNSISCMVIRACNHRVLAQAYLWDAIYDSQRSRNLELEAELNRYKSELDTKKAELASTKAELESMRIQAHDAKWALHEISNGAAHPAIKLYQNGQLQFRTSYDFRDRVGQKIWRAQAAMLRDAVADFGDDVL
jgi:hypothetical protein